MAHKLVQRNFLIVWIIVLLSLALVLTLLFTSCDKGTKVISANEIPNKTAEAQKPAASAQNTATNVSAKNTPAASAASDSSSKKDLKLATILTSTLYPKTNEIFEVTATVENAGLEKIDSFEYLINIMKGGALEKTQRGERSEGAIVGGKVKIRNEFSLSSTGEYVVEVIIDPSNKVKEFDETNNQNTATFNVMAPSTTTTQENEAPAPKPSGTCTDTDNGKIYTVKGKCTDQVAYIAGFNDFCTSDGELIEMYCKDGECVQDTHNCLCAEGACK
jgi:hypothetical protein